MKPRPYQEYCFRACLEAISRGDKRPLIVLPTGTGKSLVIAMLANHFLSDGGKVLILAHVGELVSQNSRTLSKISDGKHSIFSASNGKKELGDCTFASIQSLSRCEKIPSYGFVIIDEAHRLPAKGGEYNKLISRLEDQNPGLIVIGLTATPFRLNSGRIDRDIFSPACADYGRGEHYARFESEGYLVPLVTPEIPPGDDRGRLRIDRKTGEFSKTDIAQFLTDAALENAMANAIRQAEGRRSILIFCSSVEQGKQVIHILNRKEKLEQERVIHNGGKGGTGKSYSQREPHENGEQERVIHNFSATIITGETPKDERERLIHNFRMGKIRYLVNVEVLTTGFDAPNADAIIILRPTASRGLWIQILGRGTRPDCPGWTRTATREERLEGIAMSRKRNCLILDYAGNLESLGTINADDEEQGRKPGTGKPIPPMLKPCPGCGKELPIAATTCPECGHNSPPKPQELLKVASWLKAVNRLPENETILFYESGKLVTESGSKIEIPGELRESLKRSKFWKLSRPSLELTEISNDPGSDCPR